MVTAFPQVLLVSNRDDFTTDHIATLCKRRKVNYLRINSEDITEFSFSYEPHERLFIRDERTCFDLRDVKSVFFRRAPSQFPSLRSEDALFIFRERREFLEGLLLSTKARWINPMAKTILGERKTYQLGLAKTIGLRIPRTLITNDAILAKDFIETLPKSITKPISHGFLQSSSGFHSIYTNEIVAAEFDATSQVMMAPMLLQERVPNKADIRVTVVGEEVFAVEIVKQDDSTVDWRRMDTRKSYKKHVLPNELSEQLLLLNRTMGLVYSAIDLILSPSDEYFFLEVNPVGEWLWLEMELGIPISERIMNQLLL
ncbi:MAG: MvdC/MvdD family ATP grasp protein [Bacteroidota bacterium]